VAHANAEREDHVMARTHRLFAALYDPMNRIVEKSWAGEHRRKLLEDLDGTVLEVGAGTGANLKYYRKATKVVASEPDAAMRARLERRVHEATVPVEIVDAPADRLPFDDATFDAVVSTLVLCSVPGQQWTLAEIKRTLKPGGRFVFFEHVRDAGKRGTQQDRAQPFITWFGAGCHPNRDTLAAIESAGFQLGEVATFRPGKGQASAPLIGPYIEGAATKPSP
jgi:ubiquinone/menaquinone biosynthesis C-methylase UbiE